jgi:hypothetical protein
VAKLNEKSNDSFIVSEKIQLNGKSDYNKVVITKHQTLGLKESGIITSFYLGTRRISAIVY